MTRFRYNICVFALHLVTFFGVVLASRVHLSHKCVTRIPEPANKTPVIMLHGMNSVKESWDGIYQSVNFLSGRRVCIYDARNHGDSEWNDAFNMDILAEDLGNFMADKKIKRASLVGHSMGGMTIMKFALKNPEKVEGIFVEDIAPGRVNEELTEYVKKTYKTALDSLSAIPENADEDVAKKAVAEYIAEVTGVPYTEESLKKIRIRCKDGVWQWKTNYEAFLKAFEEEDYFLGKFEGQYNGRAFFIYGTASPFKVRENEEGIRKLFPKAELFGVEGAGHVVHANTTIFIRKLVHFLNEMSQNNVLMSP